MPKDNIERAIAKGTGADGSDADAIETVVYEGYGPGGVAIMVEALTDNRNRTGAEVRHLFTRNGGSLGEPGSVAWNFEKKGRDPGRRDAPLGGRPDGGDRRRCRGRALDDDVFEVITEPADLARGPRGARGGRGGARLRRAHHAAEQPRASRGRRGGPLVRLLEELEDHDDVAAVHANFDADASALERASA